MPCHAMPFDADAVILGKTEVHVRKRKEETIDKCANKIKEAGRDQ